jgi:hypothetical protein
MDPNTTLKEMLALVATILADYEDEDGNGIDQDDAASLASHVESMNGWLAGGGFLPEPWARIDPVEAAMNKWASPLANESTRDLAWFNFGGKGCDRLEDESALFSKATGLTQREAAAIIYGTLMDRLDLAEES